MRPTFSGFETARRALMASQKGLDVTGQNISNVNTTGYSRQRVELSAISATSGDYKYAATISSNVGQGVDVTGISRIRNQLLDTRYRKENSQFMQQVSTATSMADLENVLDEISTDGLHAQLNEIYQKLNELSKNPESIEIATVFRSSAQKVTETLNQYAQQITEISSQINIDLGVSVDDINNIATKMADINNQIKYESLQGNPSNELMDMRDTLLDELSSYSNITVEAQTDGIYAVKVGSEYLIATDNSVRQLKVDNTAGNTSVIWTDTNLSSDISKGIVKSNLDFINGKGIYATAAENGFKGLKYYTTALNDFTKNFTDEFNTLNANGGPAKPLFDGDTASTIKISTGWFNNAQYITTADTGGLVGNNTNVMRMIDMINKPHAITPLFNGTFEEFSVSLLGELAVDKSYYDDIGEASQFVVASIDNQRDSVMGVSLDEEAINMLKYEKSYNAAARLMTVLDEAVDTIISRMGLVGR